MKSSEDLLISEKSSAFGQFLFRDGPIKTRYTRYRYLKTKILCINHEPILKNNRYPIPQISYITILAFMINK